MINIRSNQMETFSKQSLQSFEDRMVIHLHSYFPKHCEALGERELRETIQWGITRAAQYNITLERDVCIYLDQMFAFGKEFDTDPELPWTEEILTDPTIFSARERVDKLHETSLWHVHQAAKQAKSN